MQAASAFLIEVAVWAVPTWALRLVTEVVVPAAPPALACERDNSNRGPKRHAKRP